MEDDPAFDCVAPIDYLEKPISVGVFITKDLIATSGCPLENNIRYPNYYYIYVPDGAYNKAKGYIVAHNIGDVWSKTYFWVYWGGRRYENNPLHDILFLHINLEAATTFNATARAPYYLPVAEKHAIEEPSGWMTAAFALVDKSHVNVSKKLVPVYYDEPVLVDCDEWFPRFWGYFICIMNLDHYPVIQSGAPLIQNKQVFGVASFTMKRGKESIYAFTDLRPYRDMIYGLKKLYQVV